MASELRVDRIIPVNGVPTGGGGGIIQVKQSLYNTHNTYSNTSFTALSGFTVSITPTRVDSKILIILNLLIEARSDVLIGVQLTREGSALFTNRGAYRGTNSHGGYNSITYLDSPATTSQITYGVETAANLANNYAINNYFGSGPANSFLTVMEVSG
jgi:hypothetical protein